MGRGSNIKQISLKRNVYWAFFGNAIYAATQWLLLIFMTKIGNIEMVGTYSFALAFTTPIILFLSFQLRNVYLTTNEYKFNEFLFTRVVSMIFGSVLIFLLAKYLSYEQNILIIIMLITFSKCIECISDIYHGLLQKSERMDVISVSKCLKGIIGLVFFGITLYISNSLILGTAIMSLIWVIILVAYDIPKANSKVKEEFLRFSFQRVKRIVLISYPLGIVTTLDALNANIPRYFIQNLSGQDELGYYSGIVYLMVVGSTVIAAVGQALAPRLSVYFNNDAEKFKAFCKRIVIIGSIFGVIFLCLSITFGKILLKIVYTEDFLKYYDVYIWIMVTSSIWYIASLLTYIITAAKFFKIQVPLFLLMLLCTFICSILLIPKYGVIGAAWSFCAGNVLRLIGSVLVTNNILLNITRNSPHKQTSF
nr:oligosaccharide flippase family protein [Paenibacillus sp. H1-7]